MGRLIENKLIKKYGGGYKCKSTFGNKWVKVRDDGLIGNQYGRIKPDYYIMYKWISKPHLRKRKNPLPNVCRWCRKKNLEYKYVFDKVYRYGVYEDDRFIIGRYDEKYSNKVRDSDWYKSSLVWELFEKRFKDLSRDEINSYYREVKNRLGYYR